MQDEKEGKKDERRRVSGKWEEKGGEERDEEGEEDRKG